MSIRKIINVNGDPYDITDQEPRYTRRCDGCHKLHGESNLIMIEAHIKWPDGDLPTVPIDIHEYCLDELADIIRKAVDPEPPF